MEVIDIVQGEKVEFLIYVYDEDDRPMSLTPWDEYKVCIAYGSSVLEVTEVANANGSVVALEGSASLGTLKVTLGGTDTAKLDAGVRQDIQLVLNNASTPNPKSEVLHDVLNVTKKICS